MMSFDPQQLMTLMQKMKQYQELGVFDEALKIFTQIEEMMGPQDLLTVSMAQTLIHAGRTKDVYDAYIRFLQQKKIELGENHPDYLSMLHNYAIFLMDINKLNESVLVWEDLVPRRSRILGELDPLTLLSKMNFVVTLLQKRDFTKVIQLAPKIIQDLTSVYGAGDSRVVKHRQHYLLALHIENPASTVEMYEQLIEDQIRIYGNDSIEVMLSRINLAQGLAAKGEREKALRTLRSALPDASRLYGENHPLVMQMESQIRKLMGK